MGTADKPPTVEETLGRLEVKMKEMELKMELQEKEKESQREENVETIELIKSEMTNVKENLQKTMERVEVTEASNQKETSGLGITTRLMEENIQSLNEKVERIANTVENVQEKMYDFEANKKNNLIFYGIPNETHEKESKLLDKVKDLIKANMRIRRELVITTASRMYTGPEVFGCRPVLVTFEEFKDREEVLKNSRFLKKSTISVTEDLSKRTRESRQELRKFMRHVKRINPEKRCFMQYDKLFIDGKVFIYSEASGSVEQQQNVLERGQSADLTGSHR